MQDKEHNISPIKQRILSYAKTLGISKRDFYTKIGVSRGTLESKTGITEDVMAKFIATYPNVNTEWLITGRGKMLTNNENNELKENVQNISHYNGIEANPISPLLELIASKDLIIREQAEEIGKLKEQITQLEKERGRYASGVNGSGVANVG